MQNASPVAKHAWVEIDTAALTRNYHSIRKTVGRAEVAATVKADAYGLGLEGVVPALLAAGCKTFFVATPQEGVAVRKYSDTSIIYTFNGFGPVDLMRRYQLRPVINHEQALEYWQSTHLPYALHIDTGMNRLGVCFATANALPLNQHCTLIMSHLVSSELPDQAINQIQLEAFTKIQARFPDITLSLSNSGGTGLAGEYAFDMVRPGIALYGGACGPYWHDRLANVVSLFAPILSVRDVCPGQSVGYGAHFTTPRPISVATLGIGYADGLMRAYNGEVWVAHQPRQILGQISMDLTTIDVTGLPVCIGDQVEIFGNNLPLAQMANALKTIDYEILTRLGHRLERRLK